MLKQLLARISELEEVKRSLLQEKMALDFHRTHLIDKISSEKISQNEFDDYRQKLMSFLQKEFAIDHELNSLKVMVTILNSNISAFERLIIGAGVAGTLLFQEFSPAFRSQNPVNPQLPNILVLNDPANLNTWPKEGSRVMGQPAKIQTPTGFSFHSTDFDLSAGKDSRNPYNYVLAKDFHQAMVATQVELEMPILQAEAKAIEKREDHKTDWSGSDYEYRLRVICKYQGLTHEVCLYTHFIDVCAGLGPSRKLTDSQILPDVAKKLIECGRLIYAQDGDVELQGDVLLYGGSAINAAWATEILERFDSKSDLKIKMLVSRNRKGLDDISTLSRFISMACESRLPLAVGELTQVRQLDNGALAVTFKSAASGTYYGMKEGEEVICDKLVVAIGQVNPQITDNLSDFKRCIYKTSLDTSPIPLGTYSQDHRIFVWGAAGTLGIGLNKTEREVFVKLIEKHANSFPYESMALGGIFRVSWAIPQMYKQLKEQGLLPLNEGFNSRQFLRPDINQATIEDLEALIASSDPQVRRQSAEAIIKQRCAVMPNESKDDPGIQNMVQLEKILSADLLVNIRRVYFPFSPVAGLGSKAVTKLSTNPNGLFARPVDEFDAAIEQLNALTDYDDVQLPSINPPEPAIAQNETPVVQMASLFT